jgi:starch synthase
VEYLVLDAPDLFDRDGGPYTDASANALITRQLAALRSAVPRGRQHRRRGHWRMDVPDIVHAHDWQAGLTPVYMKHGKAAATPTVMTVHNIAFQGQFGRRHFPELGLPQSVFAMDGVEYYGDVSFLKGGLQMATAITTVSPTYAQEIRARRSSAWGWTA